MGVGQTPSLRPLARTGRPYKYELLTHYSQWERLRSIAPACGILSVERRTPAVACQVRLCYAERDAPTLGRATWAIERDWL